MTLHEAIQWINQNPELTLGGLASVYAARKAALNRLVRLERIALKRRINSANIFEITPNNQLMHVKYAMRSGNPPQESLDSGEDKRQKKPVQLDLYDRKFLFDEEMMRSGQGESVISAIKSQPETQTAVVLNAWMSNSGEMEFCGFYEALQDMNPEKKLRLILKTESTRRDLAAALGNSNIDHVAVHGHGAWNEWKDFNGELVRNEELAALVEDSPDFFKKKETFTRLTCGLPKNTDDFNCQLGTPFAKRIFGYSDLINSTDIGFDPLHHTSPEEFEEMKRVVAVIDDTLSPEVRTNLRNGKQVKEYRKKCLRERRYWELIRLASKRITGGRSY